MHAIKGARLLTDEFFGIERLVKCKQPIDIAKITFNHHVSDIKGGQEYTNGGARRSDQTTANINRYFLNETRNKPTPATGTLVMWPA